MYTDKDINERNARMDGPMRRLWDNTSADMPENELLDALCRFRLNRSEVERPLRRRALAVKVLRYAAMLAVPVVTAVVAWNYAADYYVRDVEFAQCYVPEGGMDSLRLSDNTKVVVNSGSSVIYPSHFSGRARNRSVYVSGNCHFDVARDVAHPFIVNVGKLKVKVLGTHFSVSSYAGDDSITVTLEEGLVRAYDDRHAMMLRPNEQLVYHPKDGKMSKRRVDALAVGAWVNGGLEFADRPLAEILKAIERRYGVRFAVSPRVDMRRRYTMSFKKDEPIENVVKVLAMVSGGTCQRKTRDTIALQ